MSILIRQYRQEDRQEAMRLHVTGLNQFGASIGDPLLDQDMSRIEDVYLRNHGQFLVGLLNERIVCMGAYRKYDNETAELKRIRVDPDFQRQGFGQLILTTLEQSAQEQGYSRLVLDTTSRQSPAQRLFENNGYKETRRMRYNELELIFYEKRIGI
ncbi:GNAT family N-acetyltransferase [Paenibacillus piri]|uniref:GNAT family N-acetyltransferase n=1 Tax=Paenibacillus piri TaxID=2547395 RepID=A0A4V2ZSY7_9BACL|nr:GNAT family N-acetyltransferase [Paenibacillus piri]TDF95024.1 GNAT family N-acetyltransferase [Paenibacillus piri]